MAVIRSHQKLALMRELAEGQHSQRDLAAKYGVTHGAISQFKSKHATQIAQIQATFEDEFASLWISNKANRIFQYQQQVELINDRLEQNPADPRLGTLLRYAQAALDAVAKEMGAYTTKIESNDRVSYVVEGVDPEKMT